MHYLAIGLLVLSHFLVKAYIIPFEELENGGRHWVVLVAGSNNWYNYRHQADICHAYQIVHSHGIPDEQIIVMMYDDLAQNDENPTPGIIINQPNGTDVYKGVVKDYIQENVTPEVFLAVLRGDEEAVRGKGSGKVLKSGPKDHVFVYFADHGADGILAFPNDDLHVADLQNTIQYMYKHKKYDKMVFYIEACESGSMMVDLPEDINVFATTAANPEESSYACYYDELRQTYLGDVYSVVWMEDSDNEDLKRESLHHQFRLVKRRTNTSHVQEYGNLTVSHMKLSAFQGSKRGPPKMKPPTDIVDAVPSPDVVLAILKRKYMATNSIKVARKVLTEISEHLQRKRIIQESMRKIVSIVTGSEEQTVRILNSRNRIYNHVCYQAANYYFKTRCFNWHSTLNEFALRQLYVLVNLCEEGFSINSILQAMDKVCLARN
ncbi:legumain [Hypanus sabinus]|uniref:legumain n=1 Tax=Hypanus sabinus TaxID=79690 RepID=UPI0028C4A969|nr:legumain [Hypanus sabinus]XP_059816182.1 legumain [Hypanus sabinus]XP_059816184.1 legumain [Hypanus sabinus]XP_059816188.1 legumain [Hypanus sabinus]XP_059816189.1 legumain [Hypanus sabinus]XP_059816191.1 legumain [Hypanus sabinus]